MVKEKKVKINFWDDLKTKQAIKKQSEKEDRDVSNFIRSKLKKIRKLEKW